MLLLIGVGLGVGGVYFVQERVLPPRLSATESTRLQQTLESTERERARLETELAKTTKRLDAALVDGKRQADDSAAAKQTSERLRADLASLVESLPPDPRGGVIQVRAARFSAAGGNLVYDIVLSRERGGAKPLAGVMQLVVAGAGARGVETSIKLKPVAFTVGSFESVRGSVPLPDGLVARQAAINLLDRPEGKLLGMRVMQVK
ncbi:MAG TPA: hypothetical protein VJO99_19165 [Burkholderiaceae bacterium]|nr:hypothetical protein [Burkholderiaceae bacterium]